MAVEKTEIMKTVYCDGKIIYLNLLYGKEDEVIENITKIFNLLNPTMKQFSRDINEQLIRNSVIIIKRLKEDKATLEDLNTLIFNTNGEGRKIVEEFMKLTVETEKEQKENLDVGVYFLENYFNENSSTWKNCKDFRSLLGNIIENKID